MTSTIDNEIKLNFYYGEPPVSFSFVQYEKIEELVPKLPGIYVWRLRALPENESDLAEILLNLHNTKKIQAQVKGHLKYHYKGTLKRELEINTDFNNSSFFRSAIHLANHPIYIGISKNLNKRLVTHKGQFENFLDDENNVSVPDGEIRADTYEESANFGKRLGSFWVNNGRKPQTMLYVNYLVHPNAGDLDFSEISSEIRDVEYFLNRTLTPIFGRR